MKQVVKFAVNITMYAVLSETWWAIVTLCIAMNCVMLMRCQMWCLMVNIVCRTQMTYHSSVEKC